MKAIFLAVLLALSLPADAKSTHYRDPAVGREFQRQHPCPSTGKTKGGCPGYVRDHIKPLAGGPDTPSNMQWKTEREAKNSKNMGTGEPVYSKNEPEKWEPVIPGSIGETLFKIVCDKKREDDEAKRKAEAAAQPAQQKLIDDWKVRIQAKIKSRVVIPANIEGNPQAVFEVVLLPGGEVLSATLKKSSGNAAYDAAVERAISAAQPLPVPTDTNLFRENFQELNLFFRPKD